jgi:hypothetical protein
VNAVHADGGARRVAECERAGDRELDVPQEQAEDPVAEELLGRARPDESQDRRHDHREQRDHRDRAGALGLPRGPSASSGASSAGVVRRDRCGAAGDYRRVDRQASARRAGRPRSAGLRRLLRRSRARGRADGRTPRPQLRRQGNPDAPRRSAARDAEISRIDAAPPAHASDKGREASPQADGRSGGRLHGGGVRSNPEGRARRCPGRQRRGEHHDKIIDQFSQDLALANYARSTQDGYVKSARHDELLIVPDDNALLPSRNGRFPRGNDLLPKGDARPKSGGGRLAR